MLKTILLSALVSTAVLASNAFALGGTGGDCKKIAKQALAEAGVTDAIYIHTDKWGMGPQNDHWIYYTLPSCSNTGYVIVTTNSDCYVKQVFTRFGCHVPGLPHWSI